ncbi:MAG: peptidase S41 [Flavobacteriales bacterium]|nr:MAG: peptidase S41 [Flavobacteriales bacterium]
MKNILSAFTRKYGASIYSLTKRKIMFFVVLLLTFSGIISCEKSFLGSSSSASNSEVFDFLWNDIRNRYSYFELKQIDWDDLKDRYASLIDDGMDEFELFEVLADMLFELEDGHVNLTSSFNRSRNWDWSQNYPLNYNQGIIDRNYLGKDFHISGPLRHQVIDSILYVNYRSFADELRLQDLDAIVNRAKNLKGVIVDVRSNGGGALNNAFNLAGAFTGESYVYGKVRIKNGPCRDCFSSWTDLRVPAKNGNWFDGPVMVLINRSSYSSTTYFAEMMRQNPRATLIGDSTGGGGGSPVFGELPNGWMYRFSATQAMTIDNQHFELGIPVHLPVELNPNDESKGEDTILETALNQFR